MKKMFLKKMEETDLQQVLEWRNSERVRKAMFTDKIILWEDHKKWFDRCNSGIEIQNFVFCVNGNKVGVVNITDIDLKNKTCSWSIYRGVEGVPGIGLKMGQCAIEYIFRKLQMRKIYVDVLGNNLVSKNFHEKLGFEIEGVFRKQIIHNGVPIDVFRLSMFNKSI